MKTKTMSKLVAGAAIALTAIAPSYGQNNLGASCGCPPVNARTTVTVSQLPGFVPVVANGVNGGDLTQGGNFTCDKIYIMDQRTFVPAGQILNIQPGTVIKAVDTQTNVSAVALIIERGGKIIAAGTQDCPIVFTAEADLMNNLYPLNTPGGKWGGVLIAGKASNNLTQANNGPFTLNQGGKLCVQDGIGVFEGFQVDDPHFRFGVNTTNSVTSGEPANQVPDDNDNSGILRYVSIRHAGSILVIGGEINGLTLGSVGRGTTIENIEIVNSADDGIELFGGTVNLKHVSMLFGNDDMLDWDDGWRGKAQFIFGMKSDNTWSVDSDNGFEMDADDQKSGITPRSHPIIYNATIIGNSKSVGTSDNGYGSPSNVAAINGIQAKELTEGEVYNSIFANFKNGMNLAKAVGTRTTAASLVNGVQSEAYHNWAVSGGNASQSLKIKCNTFVGIFTNTLTVDGVAGVGTDATQFTSTDLNTFFAGNTLPGFSYTFAVTPNNNTFQAKNDVVPNPALSVAGCPVPAVDGFFAPAPYRGAFASTGDNWLSNWSYSSILGATKNTVACPTDINKDGVTDVNDFLIFLPQFNIGCN